MAATLHMPGRLILAGGFAVAIVIAPTVALLADISSPGVSVITADPNPTCTVNQSNGSGSVVCPQNLMPGQQPANGGLPSEGDLTQQNQHRQH
jgi:hypothetical protein